MCSRPTGLVYPDAFGDAHHKAVWDLRETPRSARGDEGIEGSWARLAVDRVDDADWRCPASRVSILSSRARPQIARAVASLDGEVHVIYTARDLVRQVPAVWQERIKNQKTLAYRDFVESVIDRTGLGRRSFWGAQDAARPSGAGPTTSTRLAIHVVTAPPPGAPSRLLWDRFSRSPACAGADFDIEADRAANESLSMLQTELLRRYNERHAEGVAWPSTAGSCDGSSTCWPRSTTAAGSA